VRGGGDGGVGDGSEGSGEGSVGDGSESGREGSGEDEEDPRVEVRDAGGGKGLGAFAKVALRAGVKLGTYRGERLTFAQLEQRYTRGTL
jgi:hypothetical protein